MFGKRSTGDEPNYMALAARPDLWPSLDNDTLLSVSHLLFAMYGVANDAGWIPGLAQMYRLVRKRCSLSDRIDLLDGVSATVLRGLTGVSALLPFIHMEDEGLIVKVASFRTAEMMPLKDSDPLTGPKELVAYALEQTRDEVKRGRILSGVLALGDRRVLPLLHGCWRFLGPAGLYEMCSVEADDWYAAQADFYIECFANLTDLDRKRAVVVAMTEFVLKARKQTDRIVDIARHLPRRHDTKEIVTELGAWSVQDYGERFRARIAHLAAQAPAHSEERDLLRVVGKLWLREGLPE